MSPGKKCNNPKLVVGFAVVWFFAAICSLALIAISLRKDIAWLGVIGGVGVCVLVIFLFTMAKKLGDEKTDACPA